jgi:protoporphyrinogen oxidase
MAPPGRGSVYVELAERGPLPPRARLVHQVARGLREVGVIERPDDILFADLREIRHAYVIFDHHYYAATHLLREWLEEREIYPRGRYGYWTYNSMEDSILAGRDVARLLGRVIAGPPG